MEVIKARKVVVSSGEVIVDPSSLWICDNGICYARVYVKFRVKHGNVPSPKTLCQNEVIYGSYTAIKNLSSKKTVTFADEIGCALSYTGDKITSYGVAWDSDNIANVFGLMSK